MYDFGFIGCGNMGGAILTALAENRKDLSIAVYDICTEKAEGFADRYENVTAATTSQIFADCRYIFLGLKPQVLPAFLKENSSAIALSQAVLISMAAGTSVEKIEGCLDSRGSKIIRIMPNIPVSVNEGVILFAVNGNVTAEEKDYFSTTLSCTGLVDEIDEAKIDAASAISGCGPAFAYMFIEALADGGVQCGLTRQQSIQYAAQMLLGSAKNVLETGIHPDELKDRVCSPGGTTIAGVHSLEQNAFRYAASQAVIEAYEKTLKLK